MTRTVEQYECENHQHRGRTLGIARHDKCAPFACNGVLALVVEANPLRAIPGERLVTERCQGCARVVNVWRVVGDDAA